MSTTPHATTNSALKPQLSFWQIWNMCFGFLGIQMGFALQNSNVSRIFQTLGAEVEEIPILWIAAPVTGLIVQPIIGYMSDKTWNGLGRRRPYFLWGAILSTLALFFMPNSPTLWIAAGMLWIMDASINVTMEPFRAFVGDMMPKKQRPTGFAMQSFFIGIGSVIASALPWIFANFLGISNDAPAGQIPDTVKYSFYFGGTVFFIAVMWTVLTTKEYTPEQLAEFEKQEEKQELEEAGGSKVENVFEEVTRTAQDYFKGGAMWFFLGAAFTTLVYFMGWAKELYILSVGLCCFGVIQFIAGNMHKSNNTDNGFALIVTDLFHMPSTMKQLAVVQFFSWFALFAMWIYTNAAVTQVHFDAPTPTSPGYNEGANWVGVLFAAYNGFAALAAIIIPKMVALTDVRKAHLINLCLGGLGLASIAVISDPDLLIISMVGVGFAWASILSLPYAMLSNSLPANKMGVFMGIFNFFIVIPQILAASILGIIVKFVFDGQPIYALVVGGVSMIVAGALTMKVRFGHEQVVAQTA